MFRCAKDNLTYEDISLSTLNTTQSRPLHSTTYSNNDLLQYDTPRELDRLSHDPKTGFMNPNTFMKSDPIPAKRRPYDDDSGMNFSHLYNSPTGINIIPSIGIAPDSDQACCSNKPCLCTEYPEKYTKEQTTSQDYQAYESIDENLIHTHGLIYQHDSEGEAQTHNYEMVIDFHNIKHHNTIACDDIVSGGDGRIYDDPEMSSEENTYDDIINQEVANVNVNGTVTRREQVCAVEEKEEEEHYKSVIRKMIHVADKDEEEVPHKKKTTHNYINQEIIDENVKIDDKITDGNFERTSGETLFSAHGNKRDRAMHTRQLVIGTNAEENEQRALKS